MIRIPFVLICVSAISQSPIILGDTTTNTFVMESSTRTIAATGPVKVAITDIDVTSPMECASACNLEIMCNYFQYDTSQSPNCRQKTTDQTTTTGMDIYSKVGYEAAEGFWRIRDTHCGGSYAAEILLDRSNCLDYCKQDTECLSVIYYNVDTKILGPAGKCHKKNSQHFCAAPGSDTRPRKDSGESGTRTAKTLTRRKYYWTEVTAWTIASRIHSAVASFTTTSTPVLLAVQREHATRRILSISALLRGTTTFYRIKRITTSGFSESFAGSHKKRFAEVIDAESLVWLERIERKGFVEHTHGRMDSGWVRNYPQIQKRAIIP